MLSPSGRRKFREQQSLRSESGSRKFLGGGHPYLLVNTRGDGEGKAPGFARKGGITHVNSAEIFFLKEKKVV